MLHLNIWIQKVHQNISYWQKRSFRLPSNLFHNKLLSVLKVLHLNAFDCWHNVFSKNIKTQSLNKFSMNLCIKHFTCIKPTNKQKIPLSKWHHPPAWIPHFLFQTVDVWLTEHSLYHVWWVGQSHCSIGKHEEAFSGSDSPEVGIQREEREKGEEMLIIWSLVNKAWERERGTQKDVCGSAKAIFFWVRMKYSNRIRISAYSQPPCLHI